LRDVLLSKRDLFFEMFTERLLTYASAVRPSMPARWRATPASRPALGREALDTGAVASGAIASRPAIGREALDAPCRCAGTGAGGAIGREALDAATVASGAASSRASPARRSTASRSMPLTCRAP